MTIINLSTASEIIQITDDQLVVIIPWENLVSESDRQRNLFRVKADGSVVWQVADYQPMAPLSTFTGIKIRNDMLLAYNFDGGAYNIDPDSGAIISSQFVK